MFVDRPIAPFLRKQICATMAMKIIPNEQEKTDEYYC